MTHVDNAPSNHPPSPPKHIYLSILCHFKYLVIPVSIPQPEHLKALHALVDKALSRLPPLHITRCTSPLS